MHQTGQNFITVTPSSQKEVWALEGAWTMEHLRTITHQLAEHHAPGSNDVTVNGKGLTALDTSAAWALISLLRRLSAEGFVISQAEFRDEHLKILELMDKVEHKPASPCAIHDPVSLAFVHLGKSTLQLKQGVFDIIAFFGQLCTTLLANILRPDRWRLRSTVFHINEIGIKALPIICLMSFLISIVLGYQGANQLQKFGATIFTVDLVSISVLREMAVLLTSIMVAGRSGSAFAAQIGVMKVNEEVSALRTLGLDPFELIVLPRMIALLIALPALTFVADMVGLFGTWFVSYMLMDLSFLQFINRLHTVLNFNMFWVGMVKAPVFALLIGLIGCAQGFEVESSAEEVGSRTTRAVVLSIFSVILADATFSILFTVLGI